MDILNINETNDLNKLLSTLIQVEAFNSLSDTLRWKCVGISKQVIAKGTRSLSERQAYIFKEHVEIPFCHLECWRCSDVICVQDAYDLELGDVADLCSSCKHDWEKI